VVLNARVRYLLTTEPENWIVKSFSKHIKIIILISYSYADSLGDCQFLSGWSLVWALLPPSHSTRFSPDTPTRAFSINYFILFYFTLKIITRVPCACRCPYGVVVALRNALYYALLAMALFGKPAIYYMTVSLSKVFHFIKCGVFRGLP
jgi:hypothetical protein